MIKLAFYKPNKKFSPKLFWLILGGILFFIIQLILIAFIITRFQLVTLFFNFVPKTSLTGVNILVFGIDNTRTSKRSDAIMLLHLNEENNHIGALSIPRDTRVNIANHGHTRINHAYAFGGVSLLKNTVSEFLSLPIDFYIKIDLAGVATLVDELGGVPINIPKALNYTDQAGDLYINIQKGKQVLDGRKAIQFLRFRHDNEGDIGRIRRQHQFLNQLANKVFSLDALMNLPSIIKAFNNVVQTDLSFRQMVSLTMEFKDVALNNNIKKTTVPGAISLAGGAYYWKPNITALDNIIDSVLLGFDQPVQNIATATHTPHKNKPKISTPKTQPQTHSLPANTPPKKTAPKPTPKTKKITYSEELSYQTFDTSKEFLDQSPTQKTPSTKSKPKTKPKTTPVITNISPTQPKPIKSQPKKTITNTSKPLSPKKERRSINPSEIKRIATLSDFTNTPSFKGTKIEVLNGIGKKGVAQTAAKYLKSVGASVPRFANAGNFNYKETKIVDWKGNLDQAVELAQLLNIDPNNIIIYDKPNKSLDFTLVIGQDWLQKIIAITDN